MQLQHDILMVSLSSSERAGRQQQLRTALLTMLAIAKFSWALQLCTAPTFRPPFDSCYYHYPRHAPYFQPIHSMRTHRPSSRRRRHSAYFSSPFDSEFPPQSDGYHKEDEDSLPVTAAAFDRSDYTQAGFTIPNERQRQAATMSIRNDGGEEDRWEEYLDVHIEEDGGAIDIDDALSTDDSKPVFTEVTTLQEIVTSGGKESRLRPSTKFDSKGIQRKPRPTTSSHETTKKDSSRSVQGDALAELTATTIGQTPAQTNPRSQELRTRKRQHIPNDQIARIKASISLVSVIESYNLPNFSRGGADGGASSTAKANCPFHDDHNPSLSVDDSIGLYKCWSCGAGGEWMDIPRMISQNLSNRCCRRCLQLHTRVRLADAQRLKQQRRDRRKNGIPGCCGLRSTGIWRRFPGE